MNPRSFAISSRESSASCLVTNDPLEVSPFARQDNVAVPIRSITERPSLFPASLARHPLSVPCGCACLHPEAGCRVCDVWLRWHGWFSSYHYTGSPPVRGHHPRDGVPDCIPFWAEPISVFGSTLITMPR